MKSNATAQIDVERLLEMADLEEQAGFCRACGEEAAGVEPDARRLICLSCKAPQVFGAEELILMGYAGAAPR